MDTVFSKTINQHIYFLLIEAAQGYNVLFEKLNI